MLDDEGIIVLEVGKDFCKLNGGEKGIYELVVKGVIGGDEEDGLYDFS
ncbi:hypothetical protein [Bacillus thuringiensis]|nr:hypothetical protein [Bacillus thuringiensis]